MFCKAVRKKVIEEPTPFRNIRRNERSLVLAFGLTLGSAGEALALEPGYCAPPNVVQQQLQEEGLIPLAAMNRLQANVEKQDSELVAQFVMSTSDFSRWIVIKADEPIGTRASEICVSLEGINLEVDDYRQEGPSLPVTNYRFDVTEALEECDTLSANSNGTVACNERSATMDILEQNEGERMAFQGITIDANGQSQSLWTLVADPANEQDFTTTLTFGKGATIVSGYGEGFAYAPALIDHLDGSR